MFFHFNVSQLKDDQKELTANIDVADESSATQLEFSTSGNGNTIGISYMQAITPSLTLGGTKRLHNSLLIIIL